MRYSVLLLTMATLALIGYAAWQVRQRDASPDVRVVGGMTYDGGTVSARTVLTHTFTVENPHPYAVGLEAPVAGCACTTATVSSGSIAPHGSAAVTLRVAPEDGAITGSASIVTTHGRRSAETWLFVSGKSAAKGASPKSQTQGMGHGRRAGASQAPGHGGPVTARA